MKKFLSILLVIAMVASLVATMLVSVSAATVSVTEDARKITADDVQSAVASNPTVGDSQAAKLIDGNTPAGDTWNGNSGSWYAKANGEYAMLTFKNEIEIISITVWGYSNDNWASLDLLDSSGNVLKTIKVANTSWGTYSMTSGESFDLITADTRTEVAGLSVKSIVLRIDSQKREKTIMFSELDITAHVHEASEEPVSVTQPTCGQNGLETYACIKCGGSISVPIEKTNDHDWNDPVEKTPATETTEGEIEYTCKNNCGMTIVEQTPCTGHNVDTNRVDATCEENGSVTYTCNDDGCDYELVVTLEKLGHVNDGNPTVAQVATVYCPEIIEYGCKRENCNQKIRVETPDSQLESPEGTTVYLTNDNISGEIVEVLGDGGATDARDKTKLFDGITELGDYWTPTNFWSASTGTTLTVIFDKEYIVLDAKLFYKSNGNVLKIEYFDADNNPVGTAYEKELNASTNPSNGPTASETIDGIIFQKVKKVVITVVYEKWGTGNKGGMKLSELQILAHVCSYKEEDRVNSVTVDAECKTTFDGTCYLCNTYAEGVVEYNHTFEKETGTEVDKIYTDREGDVEATCYTPGKGYKHCTVCNVDENIVLPATGVHDFENGERVYLEGQEVTCGKVGRAYSKCATEGCTAESEEYDVPATGEHSDWDWVVVEGKEPDYTHEGEEVYVCGVCGYQDASKGTQVAKTEKFSCISQKDWSVRYTDFVSPRATFKISLSAIEEVKDTHDVKVFGVVKKGDVTKEIQVYGEGATGNMASDGTFSLVVDGGAYTDDYKFSVRVEITDKEDNSKASIEEYAKNLSTAGDGNVSAVDVANYYLKPNKVSSISAALKKFYELIVATGTN